MANSCVATTKEWLPSKMLRHRRNEPKAFLYAYDLLELNGEVWIESSTSFL
jgi:hypothetical protein